MKKYYEKKGVLEKVKQLERMLNNSFPLSIRSQENNYFTIQLGAFKKETGAEKLKHSLIKKKLQDISIEKMGDLYKVYFGVFLTKDECKFYYKKLKNMGYEGRIIEKRK